ncbi:Conserved hypothetical protein [gamma proteobacterium HdN1]|nr:Conserved hypothetical protein [gamma proteobacterium HdN1]
MRNHIVIDNKEFLLKDGGIDLWLILITAMLISLLPAFSYANENIPDSNYQAQQGEAFFLLSDTTFSSDEIAKVRLEAPGRDHRRYSMESYGGVDIRVYRLENPLEFLKKQKNLHRILQEGSLKGEGVANALAYLWDNWYSKSRRVMQRAFSYQTRKEVTAEVPQLKMGDAIEAPTQYQSPNVFAPLKGFPLVSEFRYPLWDAKPIQPPTEVKLSGSSSNFLETNPGNVYIPLGKLAPGLYFVEAMVGRHRATTTVFVSNTVAISKISGNELFVWTVHRAQQTPVAHAKVLWTDGLGILQRGESDEDGTVRLLHKSPERSFVIGEDTEGGIFIAENFYYDSEVYDTRLYTFTDRPLYRPGDRVSFKVLGRKFSASQTSVAAGSSPVDITVIDANGTTLQTLRANYDKENGADGEFSLPENATAGGYELRVTYQGRVYSSAFRVAEYVKPHFEIAIHLDQPAFKSGEKIAGSLTLVYPDGSPVKNANIELRLRAQALSMVDNDLRYLGEFPVELETKDMRSNSEGKVALSLPAADRPSRYVLTVFASDGAAYRVKTTREILIERGANQYSILGDRNFSKLNESVTFSVHQQGIATVDAQQQIPSRWEWQRLEDQTRAEGSVPENGLHFQLSFNRPGTYVIHVRDQDGKLLGATHHSVSGAGIVSAPGSVRIVLDKQEYQVGETAEALVTFPEPVKDALFSLERDHVEYAALLSRPAPWLSVERIDSAQYRLLIPVTAEFSPNITLSALYVKGSEYAFQNAGIKVPTPKLDVSVRADKSVYAPGDTVTVQIDTHLNGMPAPSQLVVSVVDEMVYALQPEIAPSINDFFYRMRRNNVRTGASLSFISYDVATPASGEVPSRSYRNERGVKVLERPRREEIDTAAWLPRLQTDAEGHAQFQFVMPDSLTRWRITVRAIRSVETAGPANATKLADGVTGQITRFIRSEKPLYLKWSGPKIFRRGDQPALGVLAFNQGSQPLKAKMLARLGDQVQERSVDLPTGVSYQAFDQINASAGDLRVSIALDQAPEQLLDQLDVSLSDQAATWPEMRTLNITLTEKETPIALPANAFDVRMTLSNTTEQRYLDALSDLLDYPWGCIEQTASRLLPLSLAYPFIQSQFSGLQLNESQLNDSQFNESRNNVEIAGGSNELLVRLRSIMQGNRLRLVQMAGEDATFSWWGEGTEPNALLTAYAYYADWETSRALNIPLSSDHARRVLELYAKQASDMPPLHRALALGFLYEMRQPVSSLLSGVVKDLLQDSKSSADQAADANTTQDMAIQEVATQAESSDTSLVFNAPDSPLGLAVTWALIAELSRRADITLPEQVSSAYENAAHLLASSTLPIARGAAIRAGWGDAKDAALLFQEMMPSQPTFERALLLAWFKPGATTTTDGAKILPAVHPLQPWTIAPKHTTTSTEWRWQGDPLPAHIVLSDVPPPTTVAVIRYQGEGRTESPYPVNIQRKLWLLQRGEKESHYRAEPVTAASDGTRLQSDALYLDEITVSTTANQRLRYGLLEVSLPPGADVEPSVAGIKVAGLSDSGEVSLEKARSEPGQLSYAIPLEQLQGSVRVRHLVRFSQKGQFHLPPSRYYPMYAPARQSFEESPAMSSIVVR